MDPRSLRTNELSALLTNNLRTAFEAQGWSARQAASQEHDLLMQRGDETYAIEVKVAREARLPQLQALLADAFVRARRVAPALRARPLAIVGAAALSSRAAEQLHEYAQTFLEGAPYGMIDAHGRIELRGPGLEGVHAMEMRRGSVDVVRAPAPFDPFSDLNQWMLKVLLADRLPIPLLTAPRDPVRNARQLAVRAKVSVPVASRLVAYMKREGWLASDERRFEPLRLEESMRRWQSFSSRPVHEFRVKWTLPMSDARLQLDRAMAKFHARRAGEDSRACIAMFAAAERLGYAHARGVVQHVYYEGDPEKLLESLGATPAEENEGADLILRRPPFRESVFRGMVVREGVPVSDALQTWLDVANHPARGQEQAEHLWRRVIAPYVLRKAQP